jgi:serine/threonine-protein kinase
LRYTLAAMNQAAAELIGKTLGGRFKLTAFLGEGAMASVYRGEQDGEPRDVAVKIMHPFLLRDATFAKRFAREAKAAARIEHKNSVRMLAHGADGELLYLAMELLRGQDLFDLLHRERRFTEARAARVVMQMCGALAAAHAHGIVHRDLKPENVMIVDDPERPGTELVKVLDFGIAKILERPIRAEDEPPKSGPVSSQPPSSALTMVGALVGTPEYMSPEQSMGQPVDARSDVYACGILLFQLVTGKQPFSGASPIDVMMMHTQKAPPAPSSVLPGIAPALEKVILKALSKDPAERQQTADELCAELGAILPDLAGYAPEAAASGPRRTSDAGVSSDAKTTRAPARGQVEATSKTLPGVPAAVVIKGEAEEDSPPETLRSPAEGEEEGAAEIGVAAFVAKEPAAEKKTDLAATLASPGAAEAAKAERDKIERVKIETAKEEPAKREAAKEEPAKREAAEEEVPAASPRPEPAPAPLATVPAEGDRPFAPTWVMLVAAAVMVFLIWLARYLRLG